jgi:signal transduction histidine kinase
MTTEVQSERSPNPGKGLHGAIDKVRTAQSSLAVRIVTGVVILDLALTALLISVGVLIARTELLNSFDSSLQSKAISLRALVRYDEDTTGELIFDSSGLPSSADASHPDVFAIYLPDGELFAQSAGWNGLPEKTRYLSGGLVRFNLSDVPFRGLILRDIEILDREAGVASTAKITVVYGASLLDLRRHVLSVGLYLGGAGIVVLAVVAWLTVWSVRRSLSPLNDLTEQAKGISVRQWLFRAPTSAVATRELAPLASALGTVVGRLHDSFANQRRFTSDLAHELKTHVAIIKSSLQLLLRQERSAGEYRIGMAGLLEDCERLEGLIVRMLRLARVEQASEERGQRQLPLSDVLATCEAAMARVEALANSKNVEIILRGNTHAQVEADPEDLELVWLNLLENAVRHSASDTSVTLELDDNSGVVRVCVIDRGQGIGAEDLPHVFERFRRGNGNGSNSSGGFGLGLAICKAIVEGYGGCIELTSTVGQGTRVQVQVPAKEANAASATDAMGFEREQPANPVPSEARSRH